MNIYEDMCHESRGGSHESENISATSREALAAGSRRHEGPPFVEDAGVACAEPPGGSAAHGRAGAARSAVRGGAYI